jgi:methylated-DNA-[protein]-cysteine S-methyltransferase
MTLYQIDISTPVGFLRLSADDDALTGIERVTRASKTGTPPNDVLQRAAQELADYFSGKRNRFSVPVKFDGTDFQEHVWKALQRIPFGETRSYGQIAHSIGKPAAVRAIGGACHRNPLMIIVPCHRVVGANGSLTGFGGGLPMKEWLLKHEGVTL